MRVCGVEVIIGSFTVVLLPCLLQLIGSQRRREGRKDRVMVSPGHLCDTLIK